MESLNDSQQPLFEIAEEPRWEPSDVNEYDAPKDSMTDDEIVSAYESIAELVDSEVDMGHLNSHIAWKIHDADGSIRRAYRRVMQLQQAGEKAKRGRAALKSVADMRYSKRRSEVQGSSLSAEKKRSEMLLAAAFRRKSLDEADKPASERLNNNRVRRK